MKFRKNQYTNRSESKINEAVGKKLGLKVFSFLDRVVVYKNGSVDRPYDPCGSWLDALEIACKYNIIINPSGKKAWNEEQNISAKSYSARRAVYEVFLLMNIKDEEK